MMPAIHEPLLRFCALHDCMSMSPHFHCGDMSDDGFTSLTNQNARSFHLSLMMQSSAESIYNDYRMTMMLEAPSSWLRYLAWLRRPCLLDMPCGWGSSSRHHLTKTRVADLPYCAHACPPLGHHGDDRWGPPRLSCKDPDRNNFGCIDSFDSDASIDASIRIDSESILSK